MIKIIVAADYCPHHRISKLLQEKRYDEIFGQIKPILRNVDYSIVNLEAPIILDKAKPLDKSGPALKTTENAMESIKYAGFNAVTLANNHFYDFGETGIRDTINSCIKHNIDFVGGGNNLIDASKTLYKNIKSSSIAFINICENEFSIATETKGGSSPLNLVDNHYQIKEAKAKANYVIVIIHGGHEGYQLPSPRMKKTYRFFIDSGADVVLNHHQHCYSGHEIYKGKPIFYGLGNFCFDWEGKRDSIWNEGFMVELILFEDSINFKLHFYKQGEDKPGVVVIEDPNTVEHFFNNISNLSTTIGDDKTLSKEFVSFANRNSKFLKSILEPYSGRFLKSLYYRGILPSFIEPKRKQILTMIRCESHHDRLVQLLKSEL